MFTFQISCVLLILSSVISVNSLGLTQIELRAKYGQVGTSFNDGKSCHRTCDGRRKTCFYEYHAQYYDTMNSRCGNCVNGTLADCYQRGCIPANGCERVIMTVNQQLPGPTINVCKGDRIIVEVSNHMPGEGLSMHWHGLRQQGTPWMDGVAMVTQCPINTGSTFRYVFFADQSGTQAWHAHSGLHRVNGLAGTLVIREPFDPNACTYDYDLAEHTVLLYDWSNYLATDNPPGKENGLRINGILINGRGSYHDIKTDTYKFAPMTVFYVQRGKRHRFRIVNTSSHPCPIGLTVDGHKLTVIAVDGASIEPIVVDSIGCSAGERYDVVIDATTNTTIVETLMIVRGFGACASKKIQEFARIIFVDNIFNCAKRIDHQAPLAMEKRPSYDATPPAITLNYPSMDCKSPGSYCIASMRQKRLPNSIGTNLRNVKPYKVIPLYFNMIAIDQRPNVYHNVLNTAFVGAINSIVFAQPPIPVLTQNDAHVCYCNADNLPDRALVAPNGQTIYHCPHLIELELDRVYEFIFIDNATSPGITHPIHVHADALQVIDMGSNKDRESGTTVFANADHAPVYKDTICIPSQGFVRLRIRTLNPGYWMIHCHIDDHMKPGMNAILKVGEKEDMPPPPMGFPVCGSYLTPVW